MKGTLTKLKRSKLKTQTKKSKLKKSKIDKQEEAINEILSEDDENRDLQIKELRQELRRVKYNQKFVGALFNTIGTLLVVAALAIIISYVFMPVLQVTGSSMSPTLEEGQILLTQKNAKFETGDIIAFYYNNKILVKRVIATSGDWVNISEDGTVYVNDIELDEPYLIDKALGDCNLDFPYQVPESKIFVMGDHRSVSLDSRNSTIGCVSEEQLVGKVVFCIWPFTDIGIIN